MLTSFQSLLDRTELASRPVMNEICVSCSGSSRQFDDDSRKGPPPRGRDDPRSEVRDFPKPSNLPPRFQRQQQFHGGPGGPQILQNQQQQQQQPNQRQTPSPGSSGPGGKFLVHPVM